MVAILLSTGVDNRAMMESDIVQNQPAPTSPHSAKEIEKLSEEGTKLLAIVSPGPQSFM